MSTKAKLVLVLAFIVLVYFLFSSDTRPVAVEVEPSEADEE